MSLRVIRPRHTARLSRGFTLIELLVVIGLMTLVASIAVPRLWGQYQSYQQQQRVTEFWQDVQTRIIATQREGLNFVFLPDNAYWQTIAQNHALTLSTDTPAFSVRADGFASQGRVELTFPEQQVVWEIHIHQPDGEVDLVRTQ